MTRKHLILAAVAVVVVACVVRHLNRNVQTARAGGFKGSWTQLAFGGFFTPTLPVAQAIQEHLPLLAPTTKPLQLMAVKPTVSSESPFYQQGGNSLSWLQAFQVATKPANPCGPGAIAMPSKGGGHHCVEDLMIR